MNKEIAYHKALKSLLNCDSGVATKMPGHAAGLSGSKENAGTYLTYGVGLIICPTFGSSYIFAICTSNPVLGNNDVSSNTL